MRLTPFLLIFACSPSLELTGPNRICPNDGGCDEVTPLDAAVEAGCDVACERFSACAESCEGDAIGQACGAACADNPEIAAILVGAEDCATVLEVGAPNEYAACADERCERYGDRFTGCLVAECSAAGQVFDGLRDALATACREEAAAGALLLSTLDGLESDACTATGWSERVAAAIAGDGPGALGQLCLDGPVLAAEVCELSCGVAQACLDAEEAACLYGCATRAEASATAQCLAEAEVGDCDAAQDCTSMRQ